MSDGLNDSELHHESTIRECLSDVAIPRRSQLFSRNLRTAYLPLARVFFLSIFVTYYTHPNPIPRDRHQHLASPCCTTQCQRVYARSRKTGIARAKRQPLIGSALAGILDGRS